MSRYYLKLGNVRKGDVNGGVFTIGQNIGGIRDIATCQELVERVVAEAEKVLKTSSEKILK
jgi:NAD(P)H-dependent flavin oxidoreductase YrpB (nitropropane dioxygenase family)